MTDAIKAPTVLDDCFMVCGDCFTGIGTGDYTSFDYYYDRETADGRVIEVEQSIAAVDGYVYPGDPENDEGFSRRPCECCKSYLAGARHHCVVLSK